MKILIFVIATALGAVSFAAERAATETQARYYIYSGLLTQAAPGMVADDVALGPEFSKLPRGNGARVYEALVAMTDGKPLEVRKATAEEVRAYGARPGLREKQPLYAVDADNVKLLVQYDLQGNAIIFVGERDTPWDAPKAPELILAKAAPAASGGTRPSPQRLDWTGLFGFDSAVLTAEARETLERQVMLRLATLDLVSIDISGHADWIGSDAYNQQLSERRADAVAAYLVERGVDPAKLGRTGFGKTLPLKSCPLDAGRAALIECLAPNRRVVVEIAAIER